MNRYCIILLAAGNSSRYGSPKLLEPIGDTTLVAHAAEAALQTGTTLLVVTGSYSDQITEALQGIKAVLVHNSGWQDGMGTSIGIAFKHLLEVAPEELDAAIVCPADMPLVGAQQFQRLINAHQSAPQCIIVSDLGNAQGPPCLFPRQYFDELSRLHGPEGARSVIRQHSSVITSVAMPEAAMDIDTPNDYAKLKNNYTAA